MTFYKSRKIIKQSLPILTIASLISLLTGFVLETNVDLILAYPILLLILPAFNNVSGDIANTFASRLASKLHLGSIKPEWNQMFITQNVLVSFILHVFASLVLSGSSHLLAPLLNVPTIGLRRLTSIILISSLLSNVLLILTVIFVSFESYKRSLDPNNTTFPVLTSLGDIIGVFILMLVSNIIG